MKNSFIKKSLPEVNFRNLSTVLNTFDIKLKKCVPYDPEGVKKGCFWCIDKKEVDFMYVWKDVKNVWWQDNPYDGTSKIKSVRRFKILVAEFLEHYKK